MGVFRHALNRACLQRHVWRRFRARPMVFDFGISITPLAMQYLATRQ